MYPVNNDILGPVITHMNDPPLPRYDRTNSVPRDVLASVVDDFNSGNPHLVRREWFGAISQYD